MSRSSLAIASLVVLVLAQPLFAQGRGRKVGQQRPAAPAAAVPTADLSTGSLTGAGVRQFGSWLDDASMLPPGGAWAAVSLGHARALSGHQTDFPVIDGAVALTPRVQFGATLPYYRMHLTDGASVSGFGDVYMSSKISVLDPASSSSRFGVAVSPLVEVLSSADPASGGRWFWGLPVSLEFRGDRYRVYGAGGYFSRGAFFGSGAVEVPLTDRFVVSGALIQMISVQDDPSADAMALNKSRMDVAGSGAFILTPALAVFGSVGRTISSLDVTGTSLMVNAGISISVAPRHRP